MPATTGALPRRAVDRIEDALTWLMMATLLALLLGAGLAAITVHAKESQRAVVEQETRTQVTAVLLEDASPDGEYASGSGRVEVPAQWAGPDGASVAGVVLAPPGTTAGDEVRAWLDAAGRPVTAPADRAEVTTTAFLVGFSVLAMGSLLLAGLWVGAEHGVELLRRRYWEREWAEVEPMWRQGRSADQN
jgi:hypothetical protein